MGGRCRGGCRLVSFDVFVVSGLEFGVFGRGRDVGEVVMRGLVLIVREGDKDALGLFIWGTGSYMDRAVGQGGTLPSAMTLGPATIGAGGCGNDVSLS